MSGTFGAWQCTPATPVVFRSRRPPDPTPARRNRWRRRSL